MYGARSRAVGAVNDERGILAVRQRSGGAVVLRIIDGKSVNGYSELRRVWKFEAILTLELLQTSSGTLPNNSSTISSTPRP